MEHMLDKCPEALKNLATSEGEFLFNSYLTSNLPRILNRTSVTMEIK
jgi:hypothetical protein